MPRKIEQYLITGASGQLGRELADQFDDEEVLLKPKEMLDLTDFKQVQKSIKTLRPDVVINCAGITDPNAAEEHREHAWRVNAAGVDNLVKTCALRGVPLIHISSAHVFGADSKRNTPLLEVDPAAPSNWLGVTHLAAEQSVLGLGQCMMPEYWNGKFRYWIIRTSELYGRPMRPSRCFPHTTMRRLDTITRRNSLGLCGDIFRSYTYAPDLARCLVWLARHRLEVVSGVYHIANKGFASPYEFGRVLSRNHRRAVNVRMMAKTDMVTGTKLTPDMLPKYSVLNTEKWEQIAPFPLRHWSEAAEEFASEWGD